MKIRSIAASIRLRGRVHRLGVTYIPSMWRGRRGRSVHREGSTRFFWVGPLQLSWMVYG